MDYKHKDNSKGLSTEKGTNQPEKEAAKEPGKTISQLASKKVEREQHPLTFFMFSFYHGGDGGSLVLCFGHKPKLCHTFENR